jgi:hypothetical protein
MSQTLGVVHDFVQLTGISSDLQLGPRMKGFSAGVYEAGIKRGGAGEEVRAPIAKDGYYRKVFVVLVRTLKRKNRIKSERDRIIVMAEEPDAMGLLAAYHMARGDGKEVPRPDDEKECSPIGIPGLRSLVPL